ncbi:hypothetical protein HQ533_03220 [Candidatus Woesearchaeota archaeon]|nr:hypothetical protein [Candidatus Woesearchaeota archaeon]
MKAFSSAEIEGTRNFFRNKDFQEVEVSLGDRTFSYFVIPQYMEPNLADFVVRLTGDPEDGYVLGVSDSVDSRYRQYAVVHEFIEFIEIGINTKDRCVKALDEELKLVPEDLKPGYIRMRTEFFRNLIPYCSKQLALYTSDDLNQFRKNLAKLEELV